MGKRHGPCFHCGINLTPLWRNGPKDKPVLCNACGSRYRKRGTLEDYLPNHFKPEYIDNLKNLKGGNSLLVSSYAGHGAGTYQCVGIGRGAGRGTGARHHVTGGKNARLWSPKIPSRKRSLVVYKKITPMKRFQKQLLNMWKNYGNPNEPSPEEVLLFNNVNNFIPSNEIGLGGVLLKPDDSSA